MNKRELATVLHSLRETQRQIQDGEDLSGSLHFSEDTPLTAVEIDALCEELNCEGLVDEWPKHRDPVNNG